MRQDLARNAILFTSHSESRFLIKNQFSRFPGRALEPGSLKGAQRLFPALSIHVDQSDAGREDGVRRG